MSALASLRMESPFYQLGPAFYDPVSPGRFSSLRLRWKNPALLARLGADPARVSEEELVAAFGSFSPLPQRAHPPLAQRYIGYQFQVFNSGLGDGRGFLLGQVRTPDGALLDLGTKGSGTTPYSRGGDGHLTLKGGIRELIAAEFLHAMGVKTSRPLSLVEHDAKLWRGDEPSPTRASILVRVGESHVRFGTFERHYYLSRDEQDRARNLAALADHVIECYYPTLRELPAGAPRYLALYEQVVARTARLVAGWIRAGFCHGVLNTDNMNIAGDSFDYGPFAFMAEYNPVFTAAYFDREGLYCFERQPEACRWNLEMLAVPFSVLAPKEALEERLSQYQRYYDEAFRAALLPRLGFVDQGTESCKALVRSTFTLLRLGRLDYHGFFGALRDAICSRGLEEKGPLCPPESFGREWGGVRAALEEFQWAWRARLSHETQPPEVIQQRLRANNPRYIPVRPEIERVWEAIDQRDDWEPLYTWMHQLQSPFSDKPSS